MERFVTRFSVGRGSMIILLIAIILWVIILATNHKNEPTDVSVPQVIDQVEAETSPTE